MSERILSESQEIAFKESLKECQDVGISERVPEEISGRIPDGIPETKISGYIFKRAPGRIFKAVLKWISNEIPERMPKGTPEEFNEETSEEILGELSDWISERFLKKSLLQLRGEISNGENSMKGVILGAIVVENPGRNPEKNP